MTDDSKATKDIKFASMFSEAPGDAQRQAREDRKKKERRTQLTKKQRKRGAIRTTQINFRCSPAFRDDANTMAKALGISVADLMEQALDLLKEAKGLDGDRTT